MKKEMIELIKKEKISIFNYEKSKRENEKTFFKTKDAKSVFNRLIGKISGNFSLENTESLWKLFEFTGDIEEIKKRQEFFKGIKTGESKENKFLNQLRAPKACWKPKYGIVVVTENEKTFTELQKLKCPVKFLISEGDVEDLESYEIVQAVDCESFTNLLEQLPQSVFADLDEAYLERFLEELSGWKENFKILKENNTSEKISEMMEKIIPLEGLMQHGKNEKLTREELEKKTEIINAEIFEDIKKISVSGEALFKMLGEGKMDAEIERIIEEKIKKSEIPEYLFKIELPVKIDESEAEKFLRKQSENENVLFSEKIKKNAEILKKVPDILREIEIELIIYDFISGISKFIEQNNFWPELSEILEIEDVKNIFLDNAQAIIFRLDLENKCSILTGANSGGKTTLLEHILQIISLFNLGLPVDGRVKMPLFSEIYYFAKNKGAANKGAFENLLTQMAKIKPGKQTLILADEIESVTEPGVAGKIVCASAEYFIERNCFLIIATHLGSEIQKNLPKYARIDGIEAKGLDENYELIVDHNPILGKLANSTPELIVEKLASSEKDEYFSYLHEFLKKRN